MGQLRSDQLQLYYNYVTFSQLKLQLHLLPNYCCSITITNQQLQLELLYHCIISYSELIN
jgi:hypothetical protein